MSSLLVELKAHNEREEGSKRTLSSAVAFFFLGWSCCFLGGMMAVGLLSRAQVT